MALEDYEIATEEVSLPKGKSFSVRGIGLEDVTVLLRKRGPEIRTFFAKYSGSAAGKSGLPSGFSADLGMQLLDAAPKLVGEIIACAADEPAMADKAAKLPLNVQLEALEKIAALTFEAEGGPKKFFEAVIRIMGGTTDLMIDLNQSKIGSLASAGK